MNPYMIGAMLGLSVLKQHDQMGQAKDRRKYEAEKSRYGFRTGEHGQYVQDPSLMGNLAQGATTGLMMGDMYGLDESGAGADMVDAKDAQGNQLYESDQMTGLNGQDLPDSPEQNPYYGHDYGPPKSAMMPGAGGSADGPIGDEGFLNPYSSSQEALPVSVSPSGSKGSTTTYSPGAYGKGHGPMGGSPYRRMR